MKTFSDQLISVLAEQFEYNTKKGRSISMDSLYNEAVNLIQSSVDSEVELTAFLPVGCKVKRSANFQVFYTSKEATIKNRFF